MLATKSATIQKAEVLYGMVQLTVVPAIVLSISLWVRRNEHNCGKVIHARLRLRLLARSAGSDL